MQKRGVWVHLPWHICSAPELVSVESPLHFVRPNKQTLARLKVILWLTYKWTRVYNVNADKLS